MSSLDLEAPWVVPGMVGENLRWVALQLIEETARHAGHADIIRETLDIIRETLDGSRGVDSATRRRPRNLCGSGVVRVRLLIGDRAATACHR